MWSYLITFELLKEYDIQQAVYILNINCLYLNGTGPAALGPTPSPRASPSSPTGIATFCTKRK